MSKWSYLYLINIYEALVMLYKYALIIQSCQFD